MNRVLEVVLKLTDQFSAPLRQSETGLKGFANRMTDFAKTAVTFGALAMGVRQAFTALDQFRVAALKLEGTAKITGVSLETLNGIAGDAQRLFGLSRDQAADFAVEMAKLAAKAGDVGLAGPALQKFLDIGAARGLTAAETLRAVQQSILGIDEGTDKLFNANPSVLYQRFAEAIGTTAAKLTDQQKAQALLTAAMQDGGKVVGSYGDYLKTAAGQIELTKNRTQEFYAALGELLDPARRVFFAIVEGFANIGLAAVKGWEMLGATLVAGVVNLPQVFKKALGLAANVIADFVGVAANLAGPLSKPFERMAESIGAWGAKTVAAADASLKETSDVWTDRMLEIQGIQTDAEAELTRTVQDGGAARTKATAAEVKARAAAYEKLTKQAQELADQFEKDFGRDVPGALEAVRRKANEVTTTLRDMAHAGWEITEAQAQMRAEYLLQVPVAEQLAAITEALAATETDPSRVSTLATLRDLEFQANTARVAASGHVANTTQAEELLAAIVAKRRALLDGAADALETAVELVADQSAAWMDAAAAGASVETTARGISSEVLNAARGAIALAQEFGGLDQQTASILNNVVTLADVLSKGLANLSAGNLVGAIGSLVGVVSGIFAGDPAREALIRRLNESLRALERSNGLLLRATSTGAQIAAAQDALPGLELAARMQGTGLVDKSRFDLFRQILASVGLTISDAERIAKDIGLPSLGIENGRIGQEVVQAFVTALQTADFTGFETSFGGELDRLDFQSSLAGGFSAAEQLTRLAGILQGNFGTSTLAEAFAGVDLSTASGRATLLQRLLGIGAGLEDLEARDLGGLTGRDFTSILTRLTDLLRELDSAAPTFAATTAASGLTSSGLAAAVPSLQGVDFSVALFSPVGAIADHTARMVELLERQGSTTTITIGTINASDVEGVRAAAVEGINAALAVERDLATASGALA